MHAVVPTRPRWMRVAEFHPAENRFFPARGLREFAKGRSDRGGTRRPHQIQVREHDHLSYHACYAAGMRVHDPFEAPDAGEHVEARQDELEEAAQ